MKKFTIRTDASDAQLGTVIMQESKPLNFYSQKLSKVQLNYTTTENKLPSSVGNLKIFLNIFLGHKVEVFTDHSNLTYKTIESAFQHV